MGFSKSKDAIEKDVVFRMAQVRMLLDISVRDLAYLIRVTPGELTQLESATRPVSAAELALFAEATGTDVAVYTDDRAWARFMSSRRSAANMPRTFRRTPAHEKPVLPLQRPSRERHLRMVADSKELVVLDASTAFPEGQAPAE